MDRLLWIPYSLGLGFRISGGLGRPSHFCECLGSDAALTADPPFFMKPFVAQARDYQTNFIRALTGSAPRNPFAGPRHALGWRWVGCFSEPLGFSILFKGATSLL